MKVDNAPAIQSMIIGKAQQSQRTSSFNEHIKGQSTTQSNASIEQIDISQPSDKTHLLNFGIVSQQAMPFLSKDEVNFFETLLQKNVDSHNKYATSSPMTQGLHIKT